MSLIRRLKSRWTMTKLNIAFTDIVNGTPVWNAVDCYGDEYLWDGHLFGLRLFKEP